MFQRTSAVSAILGVAILTLLSTALAATAAPELPRVLVIGDSISMNYHEAAKSALQGVADYQGINDLHAVVVQSPVFDNWRQGKDVHFYKEAEQKKLGAAVAEAVRRALLPPPAKQLPAPGEVFNAGSANPPVQARSQGS